MVARCRPAHRPVKTMPAGSREGAVAQDDRHGARASGQGGEGRSELLDLATLEHSGDHLVQYFALVAADDHPRSNLAELDPIGDIDYAVEDAQTGVGDVYDS